jgi:hypothetical protein
MFTVIATVAVLAITYSTDRLSDKEAVQRAMVFDDDIVRQNVVFARRDLRLTAHGDLMSGKLRETWQADKIIRGLEELHPDFYPIAATEVLFTKEELIKLYWKCGDLLHRGTFETL